MSTSQTTMPDLFHPATPEFIQDPYPHYDRFRNEAPIYKSQIGGEWILTRYADVNEILRDLRFSAASYAVTTGLSAVMHEPRFDALRKSQSNWMLMRDQPDHTRLRGIVNKAFTPTTVEGLRSHIEQIVGILLDDIERRKHIDLISDFAFPLPVTVIATMLGAPVEDHEKFKHWSHSLVGTLDVQLNPERLEKASQATAELTEYFGRLVELRRTNPQNDLISALVTAEEQGSRLTTQEVLDNCILILFAGHETTVNLIGNGTLALLRHPEQLEKLRTNPDLIKTAIEELLRYDSPVQLTSRVVKEELEYGGEIMRKSDVVLLVLGSANRDKAQFPEPDRLDITRVDNKHLALGAGIHHCLGSSLARLEGQMAIQHLIKHFSKIELASGNIEFGDSASLRGLKALEVTVQV